MDATLLCTLACFRPAAGGTTWGIRLAVVRPAGPYVKQRAHLRPSLPAGACCGRPKVVLS